jgi:hypothetical protein
LTTIERYGKKQFNFMKKEAKKRKKSIGHIVTDGLISDWFPVGNEMWRNVDEMDEMDGMRGKRMEGKKDRG